MESEPEGEVVVVCDVYGCHSELVVAPGLDVHQAIEDHADWACVDGTYVCVRHQRPWLS